MAADSRPLRILPGAITDASSTSSALAEESSELAERFEEELARTLRFIAGNPRLYQEYVGGTRRAVVRTFRDSIIYRVHDDHVLVVAVARPRREPGYWRNR